MRLANPNWVHFSTPASHLDARPGGAGARERNPHAQLARRGALRERIVDPARRRLLEGHLGCFSTYRQGERSFLDYLRWLRTYPRPPLGQRNSHGHGLPDPGDGAVHDEVRVEALLPARLVADLAGPVVRPPVLPIGFITASELHSPPTDFASQTLKVPFSAVSAQR